MKDKEFNIMYVFRHKFKLFACFIFSIFKVETMNSPYQQPIYQSGYPYLQQPPLIQQQYPPHAAGGYYTYPGTQVYGGFNPQFSQSYSLLQPQYQASQAPGQPQPYHVDQNQYYQIGSNQDAIKHQQVNGFEFEIENNLIKSFKDLMNRWRNYNYYFHGNKFKMLIRGTSRSDSKKEKNIIISNAKRQHLQMYVKVLLGLFSKHPINTSGKLSPLDDYHALVDGAAEAAKTVVELARSSAQKTSTTTIANEIDSLLRDTFQQVLNQGYILSEAQKRQGAYLVTLLAYLSNLYVQQNHYFDSANSFYEVEDNKGKHVIRGLNYAFVDPTYLRNSLGFVDKVNFQVIKYLAGNNFKEKIIDESDNQARTEYYKKVFANTFQIIQQGHYTSPEGNIHIINQGSHVSNTTNSEESVKRHHFENPCVVELVKKDSYEAAHHLISTDQYKHVAVLNFANEINPGGGVINGASAQEESLFRSSDLWVPLNGIKNKPQGELKYPIPELNTHFSSNVTVFRDKNYFLLDKPFQVSVLTSAAYNIKSRHWASNKIMEAAAKGINPKVTFPKGNPYITNTRKKIISQLKAAADNGVDAIVLGAFGAGAFSNNPEVIAKIYAQEIRDRFRYSFKNVTFAIITPKPSDQKNLDAFENVLKGYGLLPKTFKLGN